MTPINPLLSVAIRSVLRPNRDALLAGLLTSCQSLAYLFRSDAVPVIIRAHSLYPNYAFVIDSVSGSDLWISGGHINRRPLSPFTMIVVEDIRVGVVELSLSEFICSRRHFRTIDIDENVSTGLPSSWDPTLCNVFPAVPVTILIPVFNGLLHLRNLLVDLSHFAESSCSRGTHIIIADDHSDSQTRRYVIELAKALKRFDTLKVTFIQRKRNLGFILNSNALYDLATTDQVILLTTDVRFNPDIFCKMSSALAMEDVALCTPFAVNGFNLDIQLPRGVSWRDADKVLGLIKPEYPDAETTVGYMMGVRKDRLRGPLFSPEYENGYGDDSDLYYRARQVGYRGILVDNALVFHANQGSFSEVGNVQDLRDRNWYRFFAKWGTEYSERIATASQAIASVRERKCLSELSKIDHREVDIVFILPSNDRRHGGVSIVFELVSFLRDKGVAADIVVLADTGTQGASEHAVSELLLERREFTTSISRMYERIRSVIATGADTVALAYQVARIFEGRSLYLVQGPELAFEAGRNVGSVALDYQLLDDIVVVSPFLGEYVRAATGRIPKLIPLGPDERVFYPQDGWTQRRRDRSVCAYFSGRPEKGSGLIALAATTFARAGFQVKLFGWPESNFPSMPEGVSVVGRLSQTDLRSLFRATDYYLDLSQYEGLGLQLLEATFCGTTPIYMENGGAAGILNRLGIGRLVGGLAELLSLPESLMSKPSFLDAVSLSRLTTEIGLDKAADSLREMLCEL